MASKIRFLDFFDGFWNFAQFSQKLPVILPNAELMPTQTHFGSSHAHAAVFRLAAVAESAPVNNRISPEQKHDRDDDGKCGQHEQREQSQENGTAHQTGHEKWAEGAGANYCQVSAEQF